MWKEEFSTNVTTGIIAAIKVSDMNENTSIIVVGMGFVGLACFAGFKNLDLKTYGFDIDEKKISSILKLEGELIEPEIKEFLSHVKNLDELILSKLPPIRKNSNICSIICLGTPSDDKGSADLTFVKTAIKRIISQYSDANLEIVIKSTVPPGTVSRELSPYLQQCKNHKKVSIVSNPEFLREGFALSDFKNPDRIIVGNDSGESSLISDIYKKHFDCVLETNSITAEFSKYYSNIALAAMISFSNEMRLFTGCFDGVDTKKMFTQFQMDRRWASGGMSSYFWPGIGYGGYCLPKDTEALLKLMNDVGFEGGILEKICEINNNLIEKFGNYILERFTGADRVIFLGSSFKVGSDDIRESRTLALIQKIIRHAEFEILILDEPASHEIIKMQTGISIINSKDMKKDDHYVVMLKNEEYREYLQGVAEKKVINIPIL